MWVIHELSMLDLLRLILETIQILDEIKYCDLSIYQSQVLESASEITFLLLLILLAKVNFSFISYNPYLAATTFLSI